MNEVKIFTLGEANRLLPELTRLLREIQVLRETAWKREVEIDALEAVSDSKTSPALTKGLNQYHQDVDRFQKLIDELHRHGCFLKDLDLGLVDFTGRYQGQMVYFCWKLGEPEIKTWHEISKGFRQRQPLNPSDLDEDPA